MKIIVMYENKIYTTEPKNDFRAKDLIENMRKILGDDINQKYILLDNNGEPIKEEKEFTYEDSLFEVRLILMKIPQFEAGESLFVNDIEKQINDTTNDNSKNINKIINPPNHGNNIKSKENCQEFISNIQGDFIGLPNLENEVVIAGQRRNNNNNFYFEFGLNIFDFD